MGQCSSCCTQQRNNDLRYTNKKKPQHVKNSFENSSNNITYQTNDPFKNTVLDSQMMQAANKVQKNSIGTAEDIDQFYKVNSLQTSLSKHPNEISRTSNNIDRQKFDYAMVEEQMKKRNKHLFIKDYSKNDYHLFLQTDYQKLPKITVLQECRDFFLKLKISNDTKRLAIQKRLNLLMQSNSNLMLIGNKQVKMEGVKINQNSFMKLIIEVQYSTHFTPIQKKEKPIVFISQPYSSIPKDIKNLNNTNSVQSYQFNYSVSAVSELMVDNKQIRQSLVDSGISQNTKRSQQIKHSQNKQSKVKVFKTFIDKNDHQNSDIISQRNDLNDYDNHSQLIDTKRGLDILLEQVDNDVVFQTQQQVVIKKTIKKKSAKFQSKQTPKEKQEQVLWHEAFILYYDNSTEPSQKDKCFSFELKLQQKNNHIVTIGKKQTFMLCQFMNGRIFEKEVFFSSDAANTRNSEIDSSFQSHNTQGGPFMRLQFKIQLLYNEVEQLKEALGNLDNRELVLNKEITNINNMISQKLSQLQTDINHQKRSPRLKTPRRYENLVTDGSNEQMIVSQDKNSQMESIGSNSYKITLDRHQKRESQNAFFYGMGNVDSSGVRRNLKFDETDTMNKAHIEESYGEEDEENDDLYTNEEEVIGQVLRDSIISNPVTTEQSQ